MHQVSYREETAIVKKFFGIALGSLLALLVVMIGLAFASYKKLHSVRTDLALTAPQQKTVREAITLMAGRQLKSDADFATTLLRRGKWRAATERDPYLLAAEQAGDTPFAYTLSEGKDPDAIVLAPRFFTDATPVGRAALMIHEMGHYRAYVKTGRSDEFDGYKAEYDEHGQLGLSAADGLVYFGMLDGVTQFVVPRLPRYKTYPEIKSYITQSNP